MAKQTAPQDETTVDPSVETPVVDQKAEHNEPETPPTDPATEQKPDISDEQKEDAKADAPEEGKSEDPKNTEPADTAIDVKPNNEINDGHTVEDGDFENYPELKDQGVKSGDKVAYGSLWVLKSITASAERTTKVSWPTSVTSKSY